MTETLRKPLELEKVREYLEQGGDPNAMIDEQTMLHEACYWGDLEIVKLLAEFGADVNREDACGQVPLAEATLNGSAELIRYLLENGAKVPEDRYSASSWARDWNNYILGDCLEKIENGMDIATAFDEYDKAVAEDVFCRTCSLTPKQKLIYDKLMEEKEQNDE